MEIQAGQLRRALMLIEPVVPRKHTIGILNNSVLLEDDGVLGTNLEMYVIVHLNTEVETPFVLPLKETMAVLKYVPGDEVITIETDSKRLVIRWKGGQYSYPYRDPDDYAPIPEMKVKSQLSVDGDSFINALRAVVGYANKDESRPALTGVFVGRGDNGIDIVAADGFRMAVQTLQIQDWFEEETIVPSKAVAILHHLWKHCRPGTQGTSIVELVTSKPQLTVSLSNKNHPKTLVFEIGDASLYTVTVDGPYPLYKRIIPQSQSSRVMFFAEDLKRTLEQLRLTAGGDGTVRLVWDEGMMTVAVSDEDESAECTLPVKADNSGRTALGMDFLLFYLKDKEGTVTMTIGGSVDPVILRHSLSPLVLIMPRCIQW
jgi:DNA polymerase-3 subunit beta